MSAGVFIPIELAIQIKSVLRDVTEGNFIEFKSAETALAALVRCKPTESTEVPLAQPPALAESEIRERLLIELSQRPDWQVRVLVERAELGLRMAKLVLFMDSHAFLALSERARTALSMQRSLMRDLLSVLDQRIADFPAVDLQATRAA